MTDADATALCAVGMYLSLSCTVALFWKEEAMERTRSSTLPSVSCDCMSTFGKMDY